MQHPNMLFNSPLFFLLGVVMEGTGGNRVAIWHFLALAEESCSNLCRSRRPLLHCDYFILVSLCKRAVEMADPAGEGCLAMGTFLNDVGL